MQQVRAESLTSSDFDTTSGLFGQAWWEYNRFYYVNIEWSDIADNYNHEISTFHLQIILK